MCEYGVTHRSDPSCVFVQVLKLTQHRHDRKHSPHSTGCCVRLHLSGRKHRVKIVEGGAVGADCVGETLPLCGAACRLGTEPCLSCPAKARAVVKAKKSTWYVRPLPTCCEMHALLACTSLLWCGCFRCGRLVCLFHCIISRTDCPPGGATHSPRRRHGRRRSVHVNHRHVPAAHRSQPSAAHGTCCVRESVRRNHRLLLLLQPPHANKPLGEAQSAGRRRCGAHSTLQGGSEPSCKPCSLQTQFSRRWRWLHGA